MAVAGRAAMIALLGAFALCASPPIDLGAQASSAEAPRADEATSPEVLRPVLLVPGWKDDEEGLATLEERFEAAGWSEDAAEAIGFADPVGSSVDHAVELRQAIDDMIVRTGAEAIDIVAHSMGGLAVRRYLIDAVKSGQAPPVRRVAFLGTPHEGTVMAIVAWGEGSEEMLPGSDFLSELNAYPLVPEGVEAMGLWTPLDSHVVPWESAAPPALRSQRVCCPTHRGLLRDEESFELVRLFLVDGIRVPRGVS